MKNTDACIKLLGSIDRSNLRWLNHRVAFLTRHGSHAYGTNTPTSDEDFKGWAVPPQSYFYGFLERFDQAEFHHQNDGVDAVIYDIRKFFKLAVDCNPSIIEVLFTNPEDHIVRTRLADVLLENRQLFISKKAKHTFSGYAVSQLKRLKSHYRWLKNPPKAPPTREEFRLPERTVIPADQLKAAQAMVKKQLDHWNVPMDELDDAAKVAVKERFAEALAVIEAGGRAHLLAQLEAEMKTVFSEDKTWASSGPPWSTETKSEMEGYRKAMRVLSTMPGANLERIAGNLLGFDDNFLELLDRERGYRAKMDEWRSYQTWLKDRNEARSELERKFGYDTKHGMHLVRLIRMGEEILEGKGVIVKRPDAQELLSIRNGAWSYEDLMHWASVKLARLDVLYDESKAVPGAPDRVKLDRICNELVDRAMLDPMAFTEATCSLSK